MSNEVLPGDIVAVGRSQNEELIPCDMLLLRGNNMKGSAGLTIIVILSLLAN
jgi:magnesium-transporting ATPase (P-type)